jgi:DNA-binding CsgD family transcriptional regulator/tetratricopeptide (TPR) repeat protein
MPGQARPAAGVLAGRAAEAEQLLDLVTDAAQGRSGGLLVEGEAGAGKTSLVRRVCSDAGDTVLCLWGTCLPLLSTTVPFLPLTAAVRDFEEGRAALSQPMRRATVRAPGNVPAAFDAWLSELCERQPVLLVVDDLQWADQSSLDVLMYLLAGPQSRRLAVVTTLREGESDRHDLRRWLADVRRLPQVRELRLAPLDRLATGQLLAGQLGAPPHESLVDAVFGRSRGNAYLATLLAQDLPAHATGLPPGLPTQLREAVARTWFGLSEPAQNLTRLVAVAGRPARAELLQEVSGALIPHLDVVTALREAVRLGVLVASPDGAYWFAHPLLAEVLEADMLPEDAREWHAGFALALTARVETAGEDTAGYAAALADHYLRAGDLGNALGWALRGADAAESAGGAAESLRLLRRALDLQPAAGDPALDRVALLQRIRAVAERTGTPEAELSAIDELLELVDSAEDPLTVTDLLVRRMWMRLTTGREFAGLEDVGRALRLASAFPESPQYARAMAGMARVEIWRGLPSGSTHTAEALALARSGHDPAAMSYALATKVMAWCMDPEDRPYDGDPVHDVRLAQSAAAQARDYQAFLYATVWAANARDSVVSRGWIEVSRQAREELTSAGAPHAYVAWLASFEAERLLFLGEWQACEQSLRVAIGVPPGTGADASCRLVAARLAAWQGRGPEAAGHLARAEDLFAEQSGFLGLSFDSVRAELAIARGDTEQAFTVALAGLQQQPGLAERLLPTAARAAADQAEALRDRGQPPGPALDRLDQLRDLSPAVPPGHQSRPAERAHATAMRALYLAEQSRGRRQPDASQAWIEAAEAAAAASLAWDETYARWRAAEACITVRRDGLTARTQLRRAHALAVDLCAAPLREQIQALAASSGILLETPGPVAARDRPVPIPGLTRRENEILGYVAAGYTYREIARALVISEKTVSAHISNLLRKTGTANRAELSQKYRRLTSTPTAGNPAP